MSNAVSRREALAATVAIGHDGFLFQRFDAAFEQIGGATLLGRPQLARWINQIEARDAWCAVRGIDYRMLVVPEKHVVYADMLPDGASVSAHRPITQIMQALGPTPRRHLLYPAEVLAAGRAVEPVFFRTDVHWTYYGSYLAYRVLMESLPLGYRRQMVPEDVLIRGDYRVMGDLGVRLEPVPQERGVSIGHPLQHRFRKTFDNRAFGRGQTEIFENDDARLPQAVLFRDSNASTMIQFLAMHFSRLVVVSSTEFFYDLVRSERPDVVITEMTERYLAVPVEGHDDGAIHFASDLGELDFWGFAKLEALPVRLTGSPVLTIDMATGGNSEAYVREGWHGQEAVHRWCDGARSVLAIEPVPAALQSGTVEIALDVGACLDEPRVTSQPLTVRINGQVVLDARIDQLITVRGTFDGTLFKNVPRLEIELLHPDHLSPRTRGGSGDSRTLSIGVRSVRLSRVSESKIA